MLKRRLFTIFYIFHPNLTPFLKNCSKVVIHHDVKHNCNLYRNKGNYKLSQKFNAIIAKKDSEGKFVAELSQITTNELPDEDVLIDIDFSTLNYKDGLAVTNKLPICQKFPMVCGIDLAGSVIESKNEKFSLDKKFW